MYKKTAIAPIFVQHVIVRSSTLQTRPSLENITIYAEFTFEMNGKVSLSYLATTESGMHVSADVYSFKMRNFQALNWDILPGTHIPDDIYNDYYSLESVKP